MLTHCCNYLTMLKYKNTSERKSVSLPNVFEIFGLSSLYPCIPVTCHSVTSETIQVTIK